MAFGQKNNLKNILRVSKSRERPLTVRDWTLLAHESVFFDPKDKTFNAVVEIPFETFGNSSEKEQRITNALISGSQFIVKFFNKGMDQREARDLVFAKETHVSDRPNPPDCIVFGAKVLVSMTQNNFNTLPFIETLDLPDAPLPIAAEEITLLSDTLKPRLATLAARLEGYGKDIENFDGNVIGIAPEIEASFIIQFGSALENFLGVNARFLRQNDSDLIILGIDTSFKILYVVIDEGRGPTRLNFGFDVFAQSKSASNDRTISYISNMDAIEDENLQWTDFLTEFTVRPPEILPSGEISSVKKKRMPISREEAIRIVKNLDKKGVLTEEEKEREDNLLLDPELKATLADINETQTEFVGDTVLGDFDALLNDINSLEDVYGNALNKVGLKSIVQQAIRCLTDQLPLDEIQRILALAKCIARLAKLPCKQFVDEIEKKFGLNFFQIDVVAEQLKKEIAVCVNDLAQAPQEVLFEEISQVSGIPVSTVEELADIDVKITIGALGAPGERLVDKVCDENRKSILDGLPTINLDLPDVDLDITFPVINPPTITLPDNLPTTDIMSAIAEQLAQAILDALTTALVDMLRGILQDIVDNCGDLSKVDFGESNINELISNTVNQVEGSPAFIRAKREILQKLAFGVDLGDVPAIVSSLDSLLDDLSSVLAPSEVGAMLGGRITFETKKVIDCLVEQKYGNLSSALSSTSKTEELFRNLGDALDKEALLDQIAIQPAFGPVKGICDQPELEVRRTILEDKGLSSDEIDQQLDQAKKRKLDRLRDLANILENDNILDGVIPPAFCRSGSDPSSGLIPRDPPSLRFMLDKTINTIYDGVHMAFNQDVASFVSSISEPGNARETARVVTKEIDFTDPKSGNTETIDNPEFLRLQAQGVPGLDDKDEITVFEEDPMSPNFSKGFVAKGLRANLRQIESNPRLFAASDGKIQFLIPSALDPNAVIEIAQAIGSDIDEASLRAITPKEHAIEYRILPGTKDRYEIVVTQKQSDGNVIDLFRFTREAEIFQNVQTFIDDTNLMTLEGVSPQEGYFSHLVAKIWAGGAAIRVNGIEVAKPDYATGPSMNRGEQRILFDSFRDGFTGESFYQIWRDTFANLSRQTGNSPMFRGDVISLVDFVPEMRPGCDPHLLDLDAVKKKMTEDYENSECSDDFLPNADGLGNEGLNPLEQSGISGAVITTIRLYVIELLLRSVFALSEFKLEDLQNMDDVLITFFAQQTENELRKLNTKYARLFFEQVLIVYNNRIEKGEINESTTRSQQVALEYLIREQLGSVIKRLAGMVGAQGDLDLHRINVEEWLPLFDVAEIDQLGSRRFARQRFVSTKNNGTLKEVRQRTTSFLRKDSNMNFDLRNGNFILERYIRVDDNENSIYLDQTMNNGRDRSLEGVVKTREWFGYLRQFPNDSVHAPENNFDSLRYGLRLVYVPPLDIEDNSNPIISNQFRTQFGSFFNNTAQRPAIFESVLGKSSTLNNAREKDKAWDLIEKVTVKDANNNQFRPERAVNSFPLISVEVEENLSNTSTQTNWAQRWDQVAEQLENDLLESPEYDFLFRYCFPLERMMPLVMIYNSVYLGALKTNANLFNGTKQQLKTVFEALLNAGDYTYEDAYVDETGGNAGAIATSQNNLNTDNDIPGVSLAAIAARTPFLILKGLVELTDTNIGIARKIVDKAKEHDQNIPIQLASLGQLPMNVFPPPPIGPGIGAPITPLGFLYLALNIDGIFDAAKGKEVKRDKVGTDIGINFNTGALTACEDTE